MPVLESSIKEKCKQLLESIPGAFTFKVHGSAWQQSGIPDQFFTCPELGGRSVWIEFKRPGEKPTQLQRITAQRIVRSGGVYLLVDDAEVLLKALMDLGIEPPTPRSRTSGRRSLMTSSSAIP